MEPREGKHEYRRPHNVNLIDYCAMHDEAHQTQVVQAREMGESMNI